MDPIFTESRIVVAALRDSIGHGVTALPMHDGHMVAKSKAEVAKEAMEKASLNIAGQVIPAERKA
ncbi:MAG: hypothetical protein KF914_03895 [Rhizobiaceae bacterium]|nr:hypothetical protein [Rhizobiaceae bacterium]